MLYFKQFPTTSITIDDVPIAMTDISVRFKMLEYLKKQNDFFTKNAILKYQIEYVTRPEEISFELYGTYDYTWSILLLNKVYNFQEDWLLSGEIFEKMIIEKYGSVENAENTVLYCLDEYGYEVSTSDKNIKTRVSAYEKLFEENEAKRIIDVFSPEIIRSLQNDFEKSIR